MVIVSISSVCVMSIDLSFGEESFVRLLNSIHRQELS